MNVDRQTDRQCVSYKQTKQCQGNQFAIRVGCEDNKGVNLSEEISVELCWFSIVLGL